MRDDDSDTAVELLTRAQLQDFLAASVGEPDEPLIRFLAWTGVRLGEALALRWNEVDLVDRVGSIRWPARLDRESQPETRFGIRTIDLATRLVKVLEELPSRAAGVYAVGKPDSRGEQAEALAPKHSPDPRAGT